MTASTPPDPERSEATDTAHVEIDLPCIQCSYNLRTLSARGKCPECGRPVQESLSFSALKHWPLNTEFACNMLGGAVAAMIFCGVGIIFWIIGSFLLLQKFKAEDPYAIALRWVATITTLSLPLHIAALLFFPPEHWIPITFMVILFIHFLVIHLVGIRLCADLGFVRQRVMCWLLIVIALTFAAAILLLTATNMSSAFAFLMTLCISIIAGFFLFLLLLITWALIASDITAKRALIEKQHLQQLHKANKQTQLSSINPEGSLEH